MPVMAVGSEEADEVEGTVVGVGRKEGLEVTDMVDGDVVGIEVVLRVADKVIIGFIVVGIEEGFLVGAKEVLVTVGFDENRVGKDDGIVVERGTTNDSFERSRAETDDSLRTKLTYVIKRMKNFVDVMM
mmetsp:Transcript_26492/g.37842  ORF Transcript_26492/g.37842 Transcript_26492/m.37842 type:complete len:129 (-) Transcript_26492:8-394(-)